MSSNADPSSQFTLANLAGGTTPTNDKFDWAEVEEDPNELRPAVPPVAKSQITPTSSSQAASPMSTASTTSRQSRYSEQNNNRLHSSISTSSLASNQSSQHYDKQRYDQNQRRQNNRSQDSRLHDNMRYHDNRPHHQRGSSKNQNQSGNYAARQRDAQYVAEHNQKYADTRIGSRPPLPVPNQPPYRVYIANLDSKCTVDDLINFLGVHKDKVMPFNIKDKQSSHGNYRSYYAVVEFVDRYNIQQALKKNQFELMGRRVKVDVLQMGKDRSESFDSVRSGETAEAPGTPASVRPYANRASHGLTARNNQEKGADRLSILPPPSREQSSASVQSTPSNASERPRLQLKPRSIISTEPGAALISEPRKSVNPFGEARPREVVLQEKGLSASQLDEEIERKARDEKAKLEAEKAVKSNENKESSVLESSSESPRSSARLTADSVRILTEARSSQATADKLAMTTDKKPVSTRALMSSRQLSPRLQSQSGNEQSSQKLSDEKIERITPLSARASNSSGDANAASNSNTSTKDELSRSSTSSANEKTEKLTRPSHSIREISAVTPTEPRRNTFHQSENERWRDRTSSSFRSRESALHSQSNQSRDRDNNYPSSSCYSVRGRDRHSFSRPSNESRQFQPRDRDRDRASATDRRDQNENLPNKPATYNARQSQSQANQSQFQSSNQQREKEFNRRTSRSEQFKKKNNSDESETQPSAPANSFSVLSTMGSEDESVD